MGRATEWKLGLVQIDDNLPLDQLPQGELASLRALADRAGVTLEVGMRGLREDAVAHLEVARTLGSAILRLVIDGPGLEPTPDQVTASLRRLAPALEHAGVTLAIENRDRFPRRRWPRWSGRRRAPGRHLPRHRELLRRAGGTRRGAGEPRPADGQPAPQGLRRPPGPGHKMGFTVEGTPAGDGRLDIPWLLRRLRELGRDPNAILELWVPPEADLEKTVAKELEWARRSLAYLRPLFAG